MNKDFNGDHSRWRYLFRLSTSANFNLRGKKLSATFSRKARRKEKDPKTTTWKDEFQCDCKAVEIFSKKCNILQNVTANHRVNDAIATEDGPQTLVGRFMYGPLDMVTLTGEKVRSLGLIRHHACALALTFDHSFFLQVDIFLMTQPQSGHWVHFDTEMTNSSGRVAYTIPKSKKLGLGVYPIKMVVK